MEAKAMMYDYLKREQELATGDGPKAERRK